MALVAGAARPVRAAMRDIRAQASGLRDGVLRRESLAALFDPDDCVRHRIGVDAARKETVVQALRAHGWVDATLPDDEVLRRVFPPLRDEGGDCPKLPTADLLAPGGDGVSHHSWPGGLALHVAFNIAVARSEIRLYARRSHAGSIDADRVVAAALWHDWAKALVLQWQPDGGLTPELHIAGTGAHHILGLAETMRRGFPPALVVTQACAHGIDPAQVANWIAAAATIAGVDPARYRIEITPECLIHNMSDQNWVFADTAVAAADRILADAASRYGFGDAEGPRYRLCYRNVALADLGADRLFVATDIERDKALRRIFRSPSSCTG